MKLVIVESPSKAKSINKYLGSGYKVIASYGHIRQLPSKKGSVDPDNKFSMTWEETTQGKKRLKEIVELAKQSSELYLATDPDREGEAISWHIQSYLKNKKIANKLPTYRVVFNSITKENILKSFENPRSIDDNLVSAYLARLSLDYLVGFGISPILWRKLPGSRSAGRVQSVALKIICQREQEITEFKKQEYWDIEAEVKANQHTLTTKLVKYNNKAIGKLDITNQQQATQITDSLKNAQVTLSNIENKKLSKSPFAPFTTSTLQQDAFNKLGFTTKKTMTLAQKLYEGVKVGNETVGLITYMRTDATQIDPAFIAVIRNYIKNEFGDKYLYSSVRMYKTKAKNAQEAHEAIRPTDIKKTPENIKSYLEEDAYKLYNLIYKRTLASQMQSAEYEVVNYEFSRNNNADVLKASGSILKFDGFYKVYKTEDKTDNNTLLPEIAKDTKANVSNAKGNQHFTEPPARYSEASLVKKLEELGIGRPSTYANIISTLQDREYIRIDKKRFYPEDRGMVLNIFLQNFFTKYVEYDFTANLEKNLDLVSAGEISWLDILQNFWQDFNANIKNVEKVNNIEVVEKINSSSIKQFLGEDTSCPTCKNGTLQIKTSKFGPFIGCSNYPDCNYSKQMQNNNASESTENSDNKILGTNNNNNIVLKKGPYGYYVEEQSAPPKRSALPSNIKPETVTLPQALELLTLPKQLGDGISLAIGKFGPYIKEGSSFYSLKEDIFTTTLARAKEIIAEQKEKKDGKLLGNYPNTNNSILLKSGKYGMYLVYNNSNIKVPKTYTFSNITLQDAVDLIKKPNKAK